MLGQWIFFGVLAFQPQQVTNVTVEPFFEHEGIFDRGTAITFTLKYSTDQPAEDSVPIFFTDCVRIYDIDGQTIPLTRNGKRAFEASAKIRNLKFTPFPDPYVIRNIMKGRDTGAITWRLDQIFDLTIGGQYRLELKDEGLARRNNYQLICRNKTIDFLIVPPKELGGQYREQEIRRFRESQRRAKELLVARSQTVPLANPAKHVSNSAPTTALQPNSISAISVGNQTYGPVTTLGSATFVPIPKAVPDSKQNVQISTQFIRDSVIFDEGVPIEVLVKYTFPNGLKRKTYWLHPDELKLISGELRQVELKKNALLPAATKTKQDSGESPRVYTQRIRLDSMFEFSENQGLGYTFSIINSDQQPPLALKRSCPWPLRFLVIPRGTTRELREFMVDEFHKSDTTQKHRVVED